MNNQTKAILNLILLFSGAALLGWLLGKLALAFTIFMANTYGAAYLLWCAKIVAFLAITVPFVAGILALVKRFHTHPRVMAALDMSSLKV